MTSLPDPYRGAPNPRPKRRPLRLWTVLLIATVLALVAAGAGRVARQVATTSRVSSPSWVPPGTAPQAGPVPGWAPGVLVPATPPGLATPPPTSAPGMSPRWVSPVASVPPARPLTPSLWARRQNPGPPRSSAIPSGLLDLAALAAKVDPGLVDVNVALTGNVQAAGTGIVLDPSGVVLTNNHVISGATSINVTDVGNRQTYSATVVGYDRTHDIAVLQMQGASGLPAATIGDSGTVAVGDHIAAIGNAGGRGGTPSIVGGTVSALNQTATISDEITGSVERLARLIQVAAGIQPGDSGGSLVNAAGEVIGVDTAGTSGSAGRAAPAEGLAISINDAIAISNQIRAGTAAATSHIGATGVLGVMVTDTAGAGRHARVAYRHGSAVPGTAITGIVPGSPAGTAGLAMGDVIVSLDGTAVDSVTALADALAAHHPGDPVQVAWVDPAGQQHSATVVLVPGPPD